jgi:hypothetical protein
MSMYARSQDYHIGECWEMSRRSGVIIEMRKAAIVQFSSCLKTCVHNGYLCTSPSAPIYEARKMSVACFGFPRQNLFSAGEKWVE